MAQNVADGRAYPFQTVPSLKELCGFHSFTEQTTVSIRSGGVLVEHLDNLNDDFGPYNKFIPFHNFRSIEFSVKDKSVKIG